MSVVYGPPTTGPVGPMGMQSPSVNNGLGGNTLSAASAHHALLQIGLMLLFVVLATMLAGMSDGAGDGAVAFMFALLVLQGFTHGQAFDTFITKVVGG